MYIDILYMYPCACISAGCGSSHTGAYWRAIYGMAMAMAGPTGLFAVGHMAMIMVVIKVMAMILVMVMIMILVMVMIMIMVMVMIMIMVMVMVMVMFRLVAG